MSRIVLIPAMNEEESLPHVLRAIPAGFAEAVIVVNNGSTDRTREVALAEGAVVVDEPRRGYGAACLAGLRHIAQTAPPDVLVFLDGDFSDYPEDMTELVREIEENGYDMVLGSRTMSEEGRKGLSGTNQFGNKLAGFFLRLLFRRNFTDLGPFRAIRWNKLQELGMVDTNYGWTIEMQIKAIRLNLAIKEIPVRYRFRYAGESKVTGSLKGSVLAFLKITYMFTVYFLRIK